MVERLSIHTEFVQRELSTELPIVSPESFPLPHRADTFARPLSYADEKKLTERRGFAAEQANIANKILAVLHEDSSGLSVEKAVGVYYLLVDWRANLPLASFGHGPTRSQYDLTAPITDEFPNCDRLGGTSRFCAAPTWSEESQVWIGGSPTPASEVMELAQSHAIGRFDSEGAGDILQTSVELPDGRQVAGNLLLRGTKAREFLQIHKACSAARGRDVSQYETGGDPILSVTGRQADRLDTLAAALRSFARMQPGECTPEVWARHAYLLFQSPQQNRGSDAVIRTFLAIMPAHLNGTAPEVLQDIDLRAYAQNQEDFVAGLTEETKWL